MTWLFLSLVLTATPTAGVLLMKLFKQGSYDANRTVYSLTFPHELKQENLLAWLNAISASLNVGPSRLFGTPTITFETWASSKGITHRLIVPTPRADYITDQLRTHIPGMSVTKEVDRPIVDWTYAVELGMTSADRPIRIIDSKTIAAGLLASVQTLKDEEVVLTQWVVTTAVQQSLPAKDVQSPSSQFHPDSIVNGQRRASRDELSERRAKLEYPNMLAVGRIAAKGPSAWQAKTLIKGVKFALFATNSTGNQFTVTKNNRSKVHAQVNDAAGLMFYPAQLNLKELTAIIGFPIGQPFIAGLPQGTTRHLFANADIAATGRVIGRSNYPGHERPIAQDYKLATEHTFIGGGTGQGKSTLMANSFYQDISNGFGGIMIDAANSESDETLFNRVLQRIPEHRIDDVIVLDINKDRHSPVGFNILDQGDPRVVADQIAELFGHLFDNDKGIWTRELLLHGLYTLAEYPGSTFTDLMPLIQPATDDDAVWAEQMIKGVKDREIAEFWRRWRDFTDKERHTAIQPLLNRMWQLTSRPETRDIITQTSSSFQMTDVLRDNKILLVNLSGLPKQTAELVGTLLINALWNAAQSLTPAKPNFLYLDEFQVITRLPIGLDDMLARARKHRLGVTLATQYTDKLPGDIRSAILNNARSRIIFQSSAKEASIWTPEFGSQFVSPYDFINIRKYEAIAQLATTQGTGIPVTLKALEPIKPTGTADRVRKASLEKYGRSLEQVELQVKERRQPARKPRGQRRPIGITRIED